MNILKISPSPHIKDSMTTQKIMLCVITALLPAVISAGYYFGLRALMLISVCVMSAMIFEGLTRIIMKREQTVFDLSAVVTGLILGLNLPVTLPFWQAAIGSFVAIVIVKQLFGGLGQNFANPAVVARIVLMLSFTSDMTTWAVPKYYEIKNVSDTAEFITIGNDRIVTGATPLITNEASYKDLFFGNTGGAIGETCAIAILIGGLYLIARRIISPAIPFTFIGTVALMDFIAGNDVLFGLLTGGLLLGAFFMATDYVTSPVTAKGKIIFGIGCGFITFIIRHFSGSYPEGVSFAILLMNIITPYIDRFTMTKPFGALKEAEK